MMFNRILCLGLILSLGTTDLLAQLSCDGDYVIFDDHTINVEPTGVDDTRNLQCALDHAVANGFPLVKLGRSEYFISSLTAEGFIGTLSGTSKATTTISVINGSINCQAMLDQGRAPSAIKFSGGEPRIRYMTIATDTPCIDDNIGFYVLHFTGEADKDTGCDSDVIYGSVDRVVIQGTGAYEPASTAIAALGEGSFFGGCQTSLLGTFKLNRSELAGYTNGVTTILHASAQVDINFSQFENNRLDIVIPNANQSTTITSNNFTGVAGDEDGYMGIQVLTSAEDAPATNRVVIHRNTFDIEAFGSNIGSAIVFDQTAKVVKLSTIASENTFILAGSSAYGIIGGGVSGSIVNENRFTGSAATGIYANPVDSPESSDWAILANKGFRNLASQGPDIVLGPDLSNSIVGANQTDKVEDLGTENSVLPIGPDEVLLDRVAALEAMVAALTAHLDTHTASTNAHHERYADNEATAAVGPHFSGSHADLTAVTTVQHHSRFTNAEAIAAVGPHSTDYSALLAGATRGVDRKTGQDTLRFTNMNLQIVSGSGFTDGATTGTGNLIIGYNELRKSGNDRNGSHMLVIGSLNNYTSAAYGGMVVGQNNGTSAMYASVSGGAGNTASGEASSVSGGDGNTASGSFSSVSGGFRNTASAKKSSISGGGLNIASGDYSSVSGGIYKSATYFSCTVGDNYVNC